MIASAPPEGTIDRWAFDYVLASELSTKLAPSPPPREFAENFAPIRLDRPGRPGELSVLAKAPPTPRSLREPEHRARVLHTFLHHELQAAELMCWAILAFPGAPRALRRGLLGICLDELRHMAMYGEHLEKLNGRFGQYPISDWFWQRVPQSPSITHYLATMGIGLEGGNLDHAERFAERFRVAGDAAGAALQDRVRDEEVPHVRFAIHWFREQTGGLDFDAWRAMLPAPLSPMVMRGKELNRDDRARAGYDSLFVEKLAAWNDRSPGI